MNKMTRAVSVGNVQIGGGARVTVQSMTNTDTKDATATINQILALEEAGCDIVRASVYNEAAALAIKNIKAGIHIPLVADVHFDHRLAIIAVENGVDKLRINPGNITSQQHVEQLVDACKAHQIPIRIGVNAGSMDKEILQKHGGVTAQGIVDSAISHIRILEAKGFSDIVVSCKASSVPLMVESYTLLHKVCDYPLHLGVTEAGTKELGTVKSAVGIGSLLLQGIGDTIRVSLTGDPINEIYAAHNILRSVGMWNSGIEIISCPTCARTSIPLEDIIRQVEQRTSHIKTPLKVAIMGCIVNGPGESKEADVGLAGGVGKGAIFAKGELICTVPEDQMVDKLIEEIYKLI